jgi:Tol biopolymer transport system component
LRVTLTCTAFAGAFAAIGPVQAADRGADRFLSNTRQLTFEGRRSGECYFAPDGSKLIFMSEREPENPYFQIYTLDLQSGDTTRISTGSGKTTCPFFHPTSERVEFASSHLDAGFAAKAKQEYEEREKGGRRYGWDYDEFFDIFSCHRDGSDLVRLTSAEGYDAEGAYSPNGEKIVFCSLRDAFPLDKLSPEDREVYDKNPSNFGEIYIMNADGSGQTRLTDWAGYDGGPFFSPDGERIIWRHFTPDGLTADVYTMKIDGTDRKQLTDFGAMSWAPFFHPSGQYCIFTTNKLGFENFELFIVDVEGRREPVRVTHTDDFDGLPVFSPDGRHICWTSNHTSSKQSQIFMADWNHQEALSALQAAPLRGKPSAQAAGQGSQLLAETLKNPHAGHDH